MHKRRFHLLGVIILLVLFSSCSSKESTIIRTADQLLWENPDSCLRYIEAHKSDIHNREQMRMELIFQHATFKTSSHYDNDSCLEALTRYFVDNSDYRSAGESKYIQGANLVQLGQSFEATIALKEAEKMFQKCNTTRPLLMGMLYTNLGFATERSRFFDIANEYYRIALPYLQESGNLQYLYTIYHFIGKSSHDPNVSAAYLDTAAYYAQKLNDDFSMREIAIVKELSFPSDNEEAKRILINNIRYVCDTFNLNYYVAPLVKILIRQKDIKQAEAFINILANDTIKDVWYKEQYYALQAELAYQKGSISDAYQTMKALHERQTEDIEASAFASTYIISQKYDAAKEQEMRLKETVKKQRAYIWIAICVLLCGLIGGYAYYIYRKGQYELRLIEEQNLRIEQQLENNRAVLKARLNERLHVARKMHFWSSHHKEQMPTELNILSPTQASKDQENWGKFYDDFNLCYDNLLLRLKEHHPALTDSDLQYIALTYLHFDVTDLSFLLDITNRTVWNRRNAVKQHLNMQQEDDLDSWIASL